MANLLPEKDIKTADLHFIVRIVAALCMACTGAGVLAAAAFVPPYLTARAVVAQAEAELMVKSATSTPEGDPVAEVNKVQIELKGLGDMLERKEVSGIIKILIDSRPTSMYFDQIVYTRKGKEGTVSLHGTIDNPALLDTYRKTLEATGMFKAIKIPVSDLAMTQLGTFNLQVSGAF